MKTQNQTDFPKCAKIIKEFREYFPDLKVIYVKENKKEKGRK